MLRIALVCEPPDGGVAEHVAHLALGLPGHGYEATLFVPDRFGPTAKLAGAGVELRTLDFRRDWGHPQSDRRVLAELVRALRTGGYDLVHAHSAKAGVLARVAAAPTGVPAVYTPHCFPFVGEVGAARRWFARTAERRLAPRTDAIVCVCGQERELAAASGIEPRRIEVVPNGVPACEPVAVDSRLAELRARGPLVGAVTVLRRQKRLDLLIACAARVRREVPDVQLAIVGSGPEEARLRAEASRLGAAVSFVPFRSPSARALQALDVYVLPSGWEALPLGLLEAQACGIPQVVTDVGGNREAVTPETGVVVPPYDPAALADALTALLRDPPRRVAMGAASRARHAERFTVERMVAGTAAVYEAVLRERISTRRGRR